MKLLLDENLSPRLVRRLAAKSVAAQHIAHIGKAGVPDAEPLGLSDRRLAFPLT